MSLHDPDKYINLLKDKFPVLYQEHLNRRSHRVHIAFDLINHDVSLNGVRWNKCLDCGQPYIIDEGTLDGSFCGDLCQNRTFAYLNIPNRNY